ncbi:hypothetical protein EMCRGX_G023230 [Ephydatia muelleri]
MAHVAVTPTSGHRLILGEGIDDVSVKVQLLSKHPDVEKPGCCILRDMYSIFSPKSLKFCLMQHYGFLACTGQQRIGK